MKNTTKYLVAVIIVILVAYLFFANTGNASAGPGIYDDFAKCTAEKGAKMYGAYWCSHCKDQKDELGNSFQYIDYTECDARGDDANPQACNAAGVNGYPTWTYPDGTRASGKRPLIEISAKTECPLPS